MEKTGCEIICGAPGTDEMKMRELADVYDNFELNHYSEYVKFCCCCFILINVSIQLNLGVLRLLLSGRAR